MEKYDAVILAAGGFPVAKEALDVLDKAPLLCCCDSAVEEALQRGYTPNVVVGDGDSLSEELKQELGERFVQVDEQDDNDLTKATRYCIERGARRIAYLGATGKREDHTIGNIFLLPRYKEGFDIEPVMLTDYGVFSVVEGNAEISSFARQQVSIFNISCKELSSEGLKWPLYPTTQLWQGTLNEAMGERFTVHADGMVILYQTYEAKGQPLKPLPQPLPPQGGE